MPHTDEQLETLSTLLHGLPAENEPMNISELDGFVAGLLVSPEMVMPSEWLPVVWGGDFEGTFSAVPELEETLGAVMEHYNRVAQLLSDAPERYQALFGVDPNSDDTLWEPWVSGFEQAMALRPNCWEQVIEGDDEDASSGILMILALHEVDQGTSDLSEESIDELDRIAPDYIAEIVFNLNRWVKSGQCQPEEGLCFSAVNSNAAPHTSAKVGRNESCPCGSGEKYKKCCGLN